MASWLLLFALAAPAAPAPVATPAPVASPSPVATPEPAAEAAVAPAPTLPPAPAANEAFVQSVAIACPPGATRTTFPLVANTLFEVETLDPISSKDNRPGDTFGLRLRQPLRYGAVELVPAGTPVHGEVTHADQNKWGGMAGELILATRYVQLPQGRLKLRASIAASGRNRIDASATTTVLFGIAGVFIQGKNKLLPPGTELSARLAEPVTFHCDGATAPSPLPADPLPATSEENPVK